VLSHRVLVLKLLHGGVRSGAVTPLAHVAGDHVVVEAEALLSSLGIFGPYAKIVDGNKVTFMSCLIFTLWTFEFLAQMKRLV
jgi:hypothetical protein